MYFRFTQCYILNLFQFKRRNYSCFMTSLWLLCQWLVACIYVGLFLESLFCYTDLSILSPVPCCLDYYSLPWILDLNNISPPSLSFNIGLSVLGLLPFQVTFKSACWYPENNFLEFWLGFHWIYASSWGKLISWHYWIFLSMNMEYFSIYLDLLYFFSS